MTERAIPQTRWPEYHCRVLLASEWHQVEVGTIAFRFDGPDPHLTYIHGLQSRPGYSSPTAEELARKIQAAAESWLGQRGGWIDYRKERTMATEDAHRLFGTPPGGFVFGQTRWGDILLERETAYAFAEAARLVRREMSRSELTYRLPTRAESVLDQLDDLECEDEDEDEDEKDIESCSEHEAAQDWEWLGADGGWPWLVATEHQALPRRLPPDTVTERVSTTLDGDGFVWPDAESVMEALSTARVAVERDDLLVDRAMGPLGLAGTWNDQDRSDWECTCGRAKPWSCACHPGPTIHGQECPACDTRQVVPIRYGYPASGGLSHDRMLGGCMVQPVDRQCRACGTLFDGDGPWMRQSFWEGPSPVPKHPVPPLERGLTALYLAAVRTFGTPLELNPVTLDDLAPLGIISGGWWTRIPGLATGCTCQGEAAAPVQHSVYTVTRDGRFFLMAGPEWGETSVGLLHATSLDEPSGSILVRHADGEVVAIEGLDSTGEVISAMIDRFGLHPFERIRAERPAP